MQYNKVDNFLRQKLNDSSDNGNSNGRIKVHEINTMDALFEVSKDNIFSCKMFLIPMVIAILSKRCEILESAYLTTKGNNDESLPKEDYNMMSAFYNASQSVAPYGTVDICSTLSKYEKYFNIDKFEGMTGYNAIIKDDLTGAETLGIINIINATIFAAATESFEDIVHIKNGLSSSEEVRLAEVKGNKEVSTNAYNIYLSRTLKLCNEYLKHKQYLRNNNFHAMFSKAVSDSSTWNLSVMKYSFKTLFSSMIGNVMHHPRNILNRYDLNVITSTLGMYLILICKYNMGNDIYTKWIEKQEIAVSKEYNGIVENFEQFIILAATFIRLSEVIEEDNLLFGGGFGDGKGKTEVIQVKLQQSLDVEKFHFKHMVTFLKKVLAGYCDGFFTEYSEKDRLKDSINNIYSMLKKSSFVCRMNLYQLRIGSPVLYNFNNLNFYSFYNALSFDKIYEAVKNIRNGQSDADDIGMTRANYESFLQRYPHSWSQKIMRHIEFLFGEGISDIYQKVMGDGNEDPCHVYPIRDHTYLARVVSAITFDQFNNNGSLGMLIENGVVDIAILTLTNGALRDPSQNPIASRPISVYSMWLTFMACALSNSVFQGSPHLLHTLFNLSVKYQYRSIHLPEFQYRKEENIANSVYNNTWDVQERIRKDLLEIFRRANRADNSIVTDDRNQYRNLLEYLSNAIIENVMSAEYALVMLFELYNPSTQKTLSLRDSNDFHPIVDITKILINKLFSRDSTFFEYFETPAVIDDCALFSTPTDMDKHNGVDMNSKEMQEWLLPVLESLSFITILQRMDLIKQYNEELSHKIHVPGYSGQDMGEMYGICEMSHVIKPPDYTNLTAVQHDISVAACSFDSLVRQKLDKKDWEIKRGGTNWNDNDTMPPIATENADTSFKVKPVHLEDLLKEGT